MGIISQYSRVSHHTLTQTNVSPQVDFTVPISEDFTDGSWTATDLALSEFGIKEDTKELFIRIGDEIKQVGLDAAPGSPYNSIQFNSAGSFAGSSNMLYDNVLSTLDINLLKNSLNLGTVNYGIYPITGCGLTYNDTASSPSTILSGFITGDLTAYGNGDFASTMGYRDTSSSEAKTVSAYFDKVLLVANDASADGFQILIKDDELTLSSTLASTVININRVIRGTDFHNSTAAQGSATQQDIRSGTYTPTATSITNISSSTTRKCNWSRVGNIVTVCGSVTITTTTNGLTQLGLSLPITSNFGTIYEASGNVIATTTNTHYGTVYSNVANDYVVIEFAHTGTPGADDFRYTYSYEVIN
jgi:hypothetical protein